MEGVQDEWTISYEFDTVEHLDAWLTSTERQRLLSDDRFADFTFRRADFLVVEPEDALKGLPANAYRAADPDPDLARDHTLFALPMGLRESSIAEVYVRGRKLTALPSNG